MLENLLQYIYVVVYSFLSVLFSYNGWKFLIFLIIWVYLPGNFLTDKLTHGFYTLCERILLNFFSGMFFLFIQYYIFFSINQMSLIVYINPVLALGWGYCLIKKFLKFFDFGKLHFKLSNKIFITIVYFGVICITMASLNFKMPVKEDIGNTYMSHDFLWQIGNINQLSSDMPFEDIRVSGVAFHYHYFATLLPAICKIIFKGDGWLYGIHYIVIYIPFFMVLSLYCLFKRVCEGHSNYATILVFFTIGGFYYSGINRDFIFHWATNINGVGLGLPCLIVLFLITTHLLNLENKVTKENIRQICFSLVMFFMLLGIKSPFALVYVLALAAFTFISIITEKHIKICLVIYLGLNIILFIIFYEILLSSGASSYLSSWNFGKILYNVTSTGVFSKFTEKYGTGIFIRFILLIPYLVLLLGLCTVPFLLNITDICGFIFKKKKMKKDNVFAIFITLAGISMYLFFSIPGSSETYFWFAVIPFIGYSSFAKIKKLCFNIKELKRQWQVLILISSVICTTLNFTKKLDKSAYVFSIESAKKYATGGVYTASETVSPVFDGIKYLKENIDSNSLVASNKQKIQQDSYDARYFYISAYAGKRCYLEGYEYSARNFGFSDGEERALEMANLFGNVWTQEQKYEFALSKGINYLVIFESELYKIPPQEDKYFHMIFKNEEISIYEVCDNIK